jgi:hypothetical protein
LRESEDDDIEVRVSGGADSLEVQYPTPGFPGNENYEVWLTGNEL